MIKIMTGEMDDDGYITKGHISNQEDLLNREKSHVQKSLSDTQVHYLQFTSVASLASVAKRIKHPRRRKKNDSDDQGPPEPLVSSPRAAYRDVGAGSTLLSRQAAAATTIQRKVHRSRAPPPSEQRGGGGGGATMGSTSPRLTEVVTEQQPLPRLQKGKEEQKGVGLAAQSNRTASFDIELERYREREQPRAVDKGNAFSFTNPLERD
jgi:hypothetical protein